MGRGFFYIKKKLKSLIIGAGRKSRVIKTGFNASGPYLAICATVEIEPSPSHRGGGGQLSATSPHGSTGTSQRFRENPLSIIPSPPFALPIAGWTIHGGTAARSSWWRSARRRWLRDRRIAGPIDKRAAFFLEASPANRGWGSPLRKWADWVEKL
ncbi:uncharacterized protein LOC122003781 [Zingiber officinale]|uniref:uncharacterized protein LOC122003781 n=1 Tax=Zingiber officinale TaxID=94328 RepID=UPI001C4D6A97|nr:uncharacterized protein LOC122003781 [Zingiber officinale]